VHGPRWRLLLIGAGQISRYLAQMAQALDYQVQACDPREEYSAVWDVAGAELVPGMPDDAVITFLPDIRSAVIALTHDPSSMTWPCWKRSSRRHSTSAPSARTPTT